MTASKLTKWLPKCLRPAARRAAPRASLALQTLEAREVPANVFHWVGGSGPGWNTPANWQENAVPTPAMTQLQLLFPAGAFSIDNINNLFVDRITLAGGDSIVLGSGVSLTLNGSAAGDQIVATGANSSIGAGDGLHLVGVAAQVNVGGATTLDFNTPLSGANGVLRKVGTGTLNLTGDASYTGQTQVQDGVLALSNAGGGPAVGTGTLVIGDGNAVPAEVLLLASNQLPTATPIQIKSDGTLNMNHFDDVIGDVELAGGALNMLDGNLAIAGLHATATTTVASDPGGHINLLNGQHTIEVDAGKVLTISAPIHNAGASVGGITKSGAGELFFNNQHAGDPNTYTGLTHVQDGTLRLNDGASNSAFLGDLRIGDTVSAAGSAVVVLGAINEIPDTVAVSIEQDGKLDLNGHIETVGPLTMNAGAVVTGPATLTLNGTLSTIGVATAAATITGNLNLGAGTRTLDVTDDTAGTDLLINGVISGGNLVKTGTGTLEFQGNLNNPNTYGTTSVADGTLLLNHGSAAAVPGTLVIGDGTGNPGTAVVRLAQFSEIANTAGVAVLADGLLDLNGFNEVVAGLVIAGGQVSTGNGTLTIGGDVTLSASPGLGSISGKLNLGGATRTFDGPGALRIGAVVSNGGITKTGTGRLILAGDNTYAGPTTLAAGELWVHGNQPQSTVTVTGGTLNPTGTIGQLGVTGGVVSPGLDEDGQPNTKDFTLGAGTYVADMYGPNDGDRVNATGVVNLTGGTLEAHRVFGNVGTSPAAGQTLTIISNDGTDPVVGTFNGLAEGATVTANGRTLQISYIGGDGNDVVLTDVTPTTPEPYAVGAGQAGGNTVRVYNPDGTPKVDVPVFEDNVSGGVRTATADVTGDGVPDLVVGTGPGTVAEVRVFDGATGQRVRTTLPFADFQGGVFVAAADFNNDGFDDIVITPDEGGGPRVSIYSGKDGAVLANFFAIDDPAFRGGARAAAGDVNGDGTPDLVVSAGFGGGPRIAVYDGTSLGGTPTKLMNDFFAFEQSLRNGAYVAVGDLNGDGKADLIFGGGPGGGPRVLALDPVKLMLGDVPGATIANFFAGNVANRGGVRVTAKNLDGDAKTDLVVGDGAGAGSHVTAYLGKDMNGGTPPSQASFDAFPGFLGGVFVG